MTSFNHRPLFRFACVASTVLCIACTTTFADQPTTQPAPSTQPTAPHVPTTDPKPRDANWMKRHESLVAKAAQGNVDFYLLGDSITDFWEGRHKEHFDKQFGPWKPGDFGVSADRTEHVLYRITHGELDGVKPKVVMLLIGTNNLVFRANDALPSTPEETAAGVKKILDVLKDKQPQAKVLLMGVFPRVDRPLMNEVNAVNEILKTFADDRVTFMNINDKLLEKDGTLSKDVMPDGLHPNEKGYEIWANAVHDTLAKLMASSDKN